MKVARFQHFRKIDWHGEHIGVKASEGRSLTDLGSRNARNASVDGFRFVRLDIVVLSTAETLGVTQIERDTTSQEMPTPQYRR